MPRRPSPLPLRAGPRPAPAAPVSVLLVSVPILAALLVATALTAPAASQDEPPAADPATGCAFVDWREIDFMLDHLNMAYATLMDPPPQPRHPVREYRKALTYDADLDSLGLDEFLRRPAAEQADRARRALDRRKRLEWFRLSMLRQLQLNEDGFIDTYEGIPNRDVTDCLRALVAAVGLDPSAAGAWYDLGYFLGVVGDRPRALRALVEARRAFASGTAPPCRELEARVDLEYAWLARDLGLHGEALTAVRAARDLGADPQECDLVEGLALAGQGRAVEARRIAAEIGEVRARYNHAFTTVSRRIGQQRPTDCFKRWIEAMSYVGVGEYALAAHLVSGVNTQREYPHAARFWADLGLIHELAGSEEAAGYYGLSLIWTPYLIHFPLVCWRGGEEAYGEPDAGEFFFLGYGCLPTAGSPFAHATQTAVMSWLTDDEEEQEALAAASMEALEICVRRGIRPDACLAVRGRLQLERGEFAGALVDLERALGLRETTGGATGDLHYQAGLAALQLELNRTAVAHIETAVATSPPEPGRWRTLGVARSLAGDVAGAGEAFDMALTLEPGAAVSWYNRGLWNLHRRNAADAARDLRMAVSLDPSLAQALDLLSEANRALAPDYRLPGRDEVRRRQETPPAVRRETGSLEIGLRALEYGRAGAAEARRVPPPSMSLEELERIHAAGSTPEIRRRLVRAYIREGRPEAALELARPYWTDTAEVEDRRLILEADRALGQTARARQLVADLDRGRPPPVADAEFWSLVAFICFDAGLAEEGLSALDAAIELDPENVPLRQHRAIMGGS